MLTKTYKTRDQVENTVQYLGAHLNPLFRKWPLDDTLSRLKRDSNRLTVQNVYGFYNDLGWRDGMTNAELELHYGCVTWTGQFTVACGDFCMWRNPNNGDDIENPKICGVVIVNDIKIEDNNATD